MTLNSAIMMLYKYQRINENSLSGLIKKKLWAAHPLSFNDPFELRLMHVEGDEIDKILGFEKIKRQQPGVSGQELFDKLVKGIQQELYKLRVICYAESCYDLLMWAHCAGDHKGVCLGFEVEDPHKPGIYPVRYNDEYPKLDFDKVWHIDGLAKILHNKSTHWSYEHEWR
jgi:DUF2971 family protein